MVKTLFSRVLPGAAALLAGMALTKFGARLFQSGMGRLLKRR
jgi:hypothetical protein